MRSPRIYHSQSLTPGSITALEPDGAGHVGRVLRMRPGSQLILFNGDGNQYPATITQVSKKQVEVQVDDCHANSVESPLAIHLGQGISRGDKMDYTLQKAVELGVTEITPLFTERCGVKLSGDRLEKKWQQWQKIVISACEQCGRNRIPVVHQPCQLDQWLNQSTQETRLTLHPRATASIKTLTPPTNGVRLIIGPEGGLSDNEIQSTVAAGFDEITLGPRILRTETAGLTVVAALQLQFGDLS